MVKKRNGKIFQKKFKRDAEPVWRNDGGWVKDSGYEWHRPSHGRWVDEGATENEPMG